jgi:hypothetical protein
VSTVRYTDDFFCVFQYRKDAYRFFKALPQRLEKFSLEMAEEKSGIQRFSRFHPGLRNRFAFLGFELYWQRDVTTHPTDDTALADLFLAHQVKNA